MTFSSGFFHTIPEGEVSKTCPCLCTQLQNFSLTCFVKCGVLRGKQTKYLREDESTRLVNNSLALSQKSKKGTLNAHVHVTEYKLISSLLHSTIKVSSFCTDSQVTPGSIHCLSLSLKRLKYTMQELENLKLCDKHHTSSNDLQITCKLM